MTTITTERNSNRESPSTAGSQTFEKMHLSFNLKDLLREVRKSADRNPWQRAHFNYAGTMGDIKTGPSANASRAILVWGESEGSYSNGTVLIFQGIDHSNRTRIEGEDVVSELSDLEPLSHVLPAFLQSFEIATPRGSHWGFSADEISLQQFLVDRLMATGWVPHSALDPLVSTSETLAESNREDNAPDDDDLLHVDLRDALDDLDEIVEEAREKGFQIPSDLAIGNARQLLEEMYALSPRRFEVYPMPEGKVAIDGAGARGRWLILLCESNGGALCIISIDGEGTDRRYADTRGLPDQYMTVALTSLDDNQLA